jgi:hypothetical protein
MRIGLHLWIHPSSIPFFGKGSRQNLDACGVRLIDLRSLHLSVLFFFGMGIISLLSKSVGIFPVYSISHINSNSLSPAFLRNVKGISSIHGALLSFGS